MNTRSRTRLLASRNGGDSSSSGSSDGTVTRGTNTAPGTMSNASTSSSGVSRRNVDAAEIARRRFNKTRELMRTERKLVRSCEHVILLNDKIRGLTKRYQRARADGFKSFRYNLRIRLAAVEGVRNMFYEYARDRAEEVAELRKELYDQNVEIVTGSDGDESEDNFSDMADTDEEYSDLEADEEMEAEDEEEDL